MPTTIWSEIMDEGSTPTFTASLVDAEDTPMGSSQVDELWVTLYAAASGTVLNGRNHVDGLNANGMTLDTQGLFTWTLSEDDMAVVNPLLGEEEHVLLREVRYTVAGTPMVVYDEVRFFVRNLHLVPYVEP
jgi:hypothetical protein